MVSIRDPIHGDLHFEGLLEELILSDEFQRLSEVKQLGLTDKVYPGATHTRFAHSIGACHLAGVLATKLKVPSKDVLLIQIAALLHDIGHYDFSHALERLAPCDHEENSARIILGQVDIPNRKSEIPKILRSHGIDPRRIVDLLHHTGTYPTFYHAILSGKVIDIDRMDYLKRDTFYTGAVIGEIDISRLIEVLIVHPQTQELGVKEKGVASLEQFLVARSHMYQQVYGHQDSHIGELMLARAVQESIDVALPLLWGDGHLMARLIESGSESSKAIVQALRKGKRAFYVPAFVASATSEPPIQQAALALRERMNENALQASLGADVLIHLPPLQRDVPCYFPVLFEDGRWSNLFDISPLARGAMDEMHRRIIVAIYCPPEQRDQVRERMEGELKVAIRIDSP